MSMRAARAPRTAARARPLEPSRLTPKALRCRKKFLRYFPQGYHDETFVAWERDYKVDAGARFQQHLGGGKLRGLVERGQHRDAARLAVAIEARTNLLFSFEKMALRDAVGTLAGARLFAHGLLELVEGGVDAVTFERWCEAVSRLPRRQSRVATWPVVTVFGFIARPDAHAFLKPNVTRRAAQAYGFDFRYSSRPGWDTYASLLDFARLVRRDTRDLRPRDLIDLQSFIWVLGSDEYP
jgi:hypothetical protein